MWSWIKYFIGFILTLLIAASVAEYFYFNPPETGATVYGFLRIGGPLLAALGALAIAIVGNQKADQRQQAEWHRREEEEERLALKKREEAQQLVIDNIAIHLNIVCDELHREGQRTEIPKKVYDPYCPYKFLIERDPERFERDHLNVIIEYETKLDAIKDDLRNLAAKPFNKNVEKSAIKEMESLCGNLAPYYKYMSLPSDELGKQIEEIVREHTQPDD